MSDPHSGSPVSGPMLPERIDSTHGVDLAVHDFGGEGPTILFAHATGFHGRVWQPLAAQLVDRFRCIAVDFRGHGDSTTPNHGSFDWAGFADDTEAVLDALRLEPSRPLYGVGHSKGGAALLLTEQRRPGTFAALWCFEPIVLSPERRAQSDAMGEHPLATGARRRREVFASRDEAYDNYASKPPLDELHPDTLRAYVAHGFEDLDDGTVRLKCRGEDEAAVYANSTSHAAYDHLDEVRCPVTIVAGAVSEDSPSVFAESVAAALPRGRYEQFTDLGHFGPLQDPDRMAAHIRERFS